MRGIAMKHRAFGKYMLGVALVLALWALLILVNRQQSVLWSEDVLSQDMLVRIHRLDGWEKTAEGYEVVIRVEDPTREYALMIPLSANGQHVLCNGEAVPVPEGTNKVYSLPEAAEPVYRIILERLGTYSVYFAERDVMTRGVSMLQLWNWAMIAVMAVMPFYTISLFLYKKSESYLLYFFIYQCVLLFWGIVRFSSEPSQIIPKWNTYSFAFVWLVSVISLKYCIDTSEIRSPGWLVKLTSWRAMFVLAALCCVLMYRYRNIRPIMNVLVYFLCVLVMANAMNRGVKGAGWLFCGAVLRVGFSPIIYLSPFREILGQECFWYFVLSRTYFIDLPFLLGGMLFINQKFAHQFTESERLAKHLDELVGERTRELELAHAERQSMILNITHDLRTPLFVMKNCLDMVEENPQSLPDMLPVIQERSNFVSSLTEDLFLLVKLQEGKLMLNQQREDLAELLEELWVGMTVEAEKRGIRVAHRLIPQQYVWGDRVRLQQIFQNLVSNAFHYTPEGGDVSICMDVTDEAPEGVQIDAECMAVQEQLRWITVTVRDSGKGISPADAEHIFERYFYTKAENKHDSSGLGLSIAKELTLLHHGTIDFTSEEGRGTEFRVTLPLC